MKNIAFIGLGAMGYPMAGHLGRAGSLLVDQLYGDVEAVGGGRWHTSSLLARLENFLREERS